MPEDLNSENSITRPSHESLLHMRYIRDMLKDIEGEMPQVRGIAFFGSRTRHQERQDPNNPSDLDTVVFYDGSEYTESGNFEILDKNGNLTPDFQVKNEKYQNEKNLYNELQRKIKHRFGEQMIKRGLPVEIDSGINGTILVEDISTTSTDKALKNLIDYIDANDADITIRRDVINSPAFHLASRFLLGAGEELYKNRDYILNRLDEMENNGEQGERYFKGLMNCVRELQSGEVLIEKELPQNIQEARSYFRTI